MSYKVDNAIILAAGCSSRFAPLSYETHKGLLSVKGEVLIERQIKQLKEAGVNDIYIVVGYKKELFKYLEDEFSVHLIDNPEYEHRNNHSSIYAAKDYIKNSYICSSDNYFSVNPFSDYEEESYYSAVYSEDYINEWCIKTDCDGYISDVKIGSSNAWYMLGHTFWDECFSKQFIEILEKEYDLEITKGLLWESVFLKHTDILRMKVKKYSDGVIYEFDSLDELRSFDSSYVDNTHSAIIKSLAVKLNCNEGELYDIIAITKDNEALGFEYSYKNNKYKYFYGGKDFERKV